MRWNQEYWLVVYRKKGGRKIHCTAFDTAKEGWKWGRTSGMIILYAASGIVTVGLEADK